MQQSQSRVKLAIMSIGLLMMGVMAIATGLSVIAARFPEVSQTSIQLLITLPCVVIIVVTPIVGKLQEYISMKTLVLLGIICFLAGGVLPAFLTSFSLILVCRAILGIGVGTVQVPASIVVAGQNLGSFLCPYIITPLSALMSSDINMYAFITGAIWLGIMGVLALIWGMAKNAREAASSKISA
ncbi:MAG: hypothetical protein IMW96_06800 [Thermoanaerobacteraceae bacterium]|nr:hypothetical protein [Thermoanaerobacteraceae bacterium]